MRVDKDARVLLISSAPASIAEKREQLIASTTTLFDQLLPAPSARAAAPDPSPARPRRPSPPSELPDDPEEPRVPLVDAELKGSHFEYEMGSRSVPMDSQTIVLFVLANEAHYRLVLDQLARRQPYLSGWARKARELTGFVLEMPLSGAFLESAPGMEEWSPEHELVNRLAQLLLIRRFRQQPFWFQQGFAWFVELSLFDSIYCFPFRTGFVSVSEHTGWDSDLKNAYASKTLEMTDFATWQREKFDPKAAKVAWGVVDYLAHAKTAKLPALLEDLRTFREKNDRRSTGPGTWESIPGYEIPPDAMREILERHAGKTFLKDASAAFAGGKLGKPKKG
jgi:hypothetical protein